MSEPQTEPSGVISILRNIQHSSGKKLLFVKGLTLKKNFPKKVIGPDLKDFSFDTLTNFLWTLSFYIYCETSTNKNRQCFTLNTFFEQKVGVE